MHRHALPARATLIPAVLVLMTMAWTLQPITADSKAADTRTPCVLDIYGAKNISLMEFRFMWTVLLAHVPHQCGCRFLLKDRDDAPAAILALKDYKQPSMVLVAARGVAIEEQEAILKAGPSAQAKLVVIHQSDERARHDLSWYPYVKAVFKNYHRDPSSLKDHMSYLHVGMDRPLRLPNSIPSYSISAVNNGAVKAKHRLRRRDVLATPLSTPVNPRTGNVYWIPLGFGEPFVPAGALQTGIMSRPLLWSWTGSLGGKPERVEMVKYFNTTEMLKHGVLHTFHQFKGLEQLPPVKYSTLLYESKFVPLPPGIHPEQFRIYEVFAAGAIPLALKTHKHAGMAHVTALRFKALWLNSWSEAPFVMKELLTNQSMQHEMNAWQQHNSLQYVRVMRLIKQHVAEVLCTVTVE